MNYVFKGFQNFFKDFNSDYFELWLLCFNSAKEIKNSSADYLFNGFSKLFLTCF